MNIRKYIASILIIASFSQSCIHQQSYPYKQGSFPKKAQTISKATQNKSTHVLKNNLEQIFNKLTSRSYTITLQDERFVKFLGSKTNRTLQEEATLSLGVTHLFIRHIKTDEKFSTSSNLAAQPNTKKEEKKTSLTNYAKKYNVDIIHNYQNNFYLNSLDSLTILQKLCSQKIPEQQKLQEILNNKKTISYNKLASLKKNQTINIEPSKEQEKENNQELLFESSELYNEDGQNLFNNVKILTDQGKYNEAIEILNKVETDSLYYLTAKSKIKAISNLAAEELRQSAAESFNKALPTSDISARIKYLIKSKEFLIKAKNSYPESDQIETINQNLEIIESNLKILSYHP